MQIKATCPYCHTPIKHEFSREHDEMHLNADYYAVVECYSFQKNPMHPDTEEGCRRHFVVQVRLEVTIEERKIVGEE